MQSFIYFPLPPPPRPEVCALSLLLPRHRRGCAAGWVRAPRGKVTIAALSAEAPASPSRVSGRQRKDGGGGERGPGNGAPGPGRSFSRGGPAAEGHRHSRPRLLPGSGERAPWGAHHGLEEAACWPLAAGRCWVEGSGSSGAIVSAASHGPRGGEAAQRRQGVWHPQVGGAGLVAGLGLGEANPLCPRGGNGSLALAVAGSALVSPPPPYLDPWEGGFIREVVRDSLGT